MNELMIAFSGLPLGIWVYLLAFHGGFWRERPAPRPNFSINTFPEIVAVVPARNEADVVTGAVKGLLGQNYPGLFQVLLIDDGSSDGTAERARLAAKEMGAPERLTVASAGALPEGWTGKIWAVHRGLKLAGDKAPKAKYVWLTDADILHGPDVLQALVERAEKEGLVLTSLMVRLQIGTLAERALIPAYVYFFEMLYPFRWINDPARAMAGAAGGCMLANLKALKAAGGIASIRGQLIDDCALARQLKKQGPIWLGLSDESRSLRGYSNWASVWRLIARSAFTQLRHSLLLLLVCILGMFATYLAPPLLSVAVDPVARTFGLTAWAAMTFSFLPTLRYHNVSVLWAPLLPMIALFYMAATIDSARRHWLGRGGEWKGRMQARGTA